MLESTGCSSPVSTSETPLHHLVVRLILSSLWNRDASQTLVTGEQTEVRGPDNFRVLGRPPYNAWSRSALAALVIIGHAGL